MRQKESLSISNYAKCYECSWLSWWQQSRGPWQPQKAHKELNYCKYAWRGLLILSKLFTFCFQVDKMYTHTSVTMCPSHTYARTHIFNAQVRLISMHSGAHSRMHA